MALTLITFFFLSKTFENNQSQYLGTYGGDYFLFSIIGIAFLDHFFNLIRSLSFAIRNAQAFGYIDAILQTKRNIISVMFAMLAYPYMKGNIKFVLYLFLASLIGQHPLPFEAYALSSLVLFLSSFFVVGIAFLSGAFVLVYKQANPINYLANTIVSIFSGIIYPVSVLPSYLQMISEIIPATYSLELIRSIIFSQNLEFKIDIINILLIPSIIALISIIVFNFALTKIKNAPSNNKDIHYKINEGISYQSIDNQFIILNMNNGEYYELNSSSSFIWDQIIKMSSEEIILETAQIQFNLSEDQIKEVSATLEKFVDLELVSKSEIEKN